ncbi:MAG TPA: glycosyltransferase family 4 protein [Planctomycetota bacterium]|nr:glycosyltransferase family 4 protein [Planctomycetota bacterium]
MKIFHVCADPGVAVDGAKGAAAHFRSLHAALARAGCDVTAFVARPPRRAESFPGRTQPAERLREEARRSRPDLILERYALGATEGLDVARLVDARFALEVNAPLVDEASAHRPGTVKPGDVAAEARLFRESGLVLPVSAPLARFVEGVRESERGVHVLRNGFESALFADAATPRERDGGELEIAFLGRPRPWHGAARLPPLVAELRRRGVPARCVVVGGGDGADALRAETERLGLASWFEFTGDLPQATAVARFRRADLAVAPYPPLAFFYFCPLKVVEALAAGVALVTVAQGDIPEIVGDAAVLVDAADKGGFVDACEALLRDPARRAALAARGRERAFAAFTWDRVAERLLALVRGSAAS